MRYRRSTIPGVFTSLVLLACVAAPPMAVAESLAEDIASQGWIVVSARSDNGTWDLFLMRPDGSERRAITATDDYEEAAPRFSPDSTRLLYRRLAKGTQIDHDKWGFQGQLMIAAPDGSGAQPLGNDGEYPWASWMPDGDAIACLEPKGIKIIDLESGSVIREMPRKGIYQQLFMSPDGRWLCGTGNAGAQAWSIVRIDRSDETSNLVHVFQSCTPDWFPDSEHILFSSRPDGQSAGDGYGWTQLWMARGDGTGARLVYGEEGAHIYGGTLSPDGRYVIFTRSPKDGGGAEASGAPMRIVRMADTPAIAGESPELRAKHPDAKEAEWVDLPMGWEPHWTFAEVVTK